MITCLLGIGFQKPPKKEMSPKSPPAKKFLENVITNGGK